MQRHYNDYDRKKAVAAKERKRVAEPQFEEPHRKVRVPRTKARFRIQIQDFKLGDSLTLSLKQLPWRGRFISGDGQQFSTAKVCRTISTALNHP